MKEMMIEGWDYTTAPCRTPDNPVFYFIPDYQWISYLNFNGPFNIPVKVENTGKYDGVYWIRMDQQPHTDWYAGFLPITFDGYPPSLGTVRLHIPPTNLVEDKDYMCGVHSCVRNGCC